MDDLPLVHSAVRITGLSVIVRWWPVIVVSVVIGRAGTAKIFVPTLP